eukprot:CAMPEP_0202413078 /NCGR_PEP_ID=MMETSP1128-20130828/28097_1 /ASSEMBLY_ACC=CAM_ASM_000463 /TAXON_ID=3047 /ORGANISM="Dunaliella tertiolecta, Strain CCMP1320" /LENGTH=63 /DNA_ID=CAMNT_0049019149 /DNA_START=495 /DNA_END=687 /DNA_ORIENTATION=+
MWHKVIEARGGSTGNGGVVSEAEAVVVRLQIEIEEGGVALQVVQQACAVQHSPVEDVEMEEGC